MAQIIPSITSLPVDSSAAPSVEDIQDRLPSICVDYLSHNWREEDVWASWRSMTRHKNDIANGVRLENASWRTWQKQRNKLKTISPETLNWLKDSDVTWLYGPLHTAAVEPVRPLKVATADERLGIDLPQGARSAGPQSATVPKKPILKHRTLSEMLTIPMPSSPILEAGGGDDLDSSEDGDRPPLLKTKSDTNIIRARTGNARRKSPPRGPLSSGKHTPMTGEQTPLEPTLSGGSNKRHISFNTFVEQCVAVDDPSQNRVPELDDSDEEMLEMRSSSTSSTSRSSRPSLSRNLSSTSEHLTIAMIAPTVLKTPGAVNVHALPNMVYAPPPEYLSPNPQSQGFDFPSPVVQSGSRWQSGNGGDDDEEYGSVGYDYFGGPDLGGVAAQAQDINNKGKVQPVQVGQSYGGARAPPTVGTPPVQPKWRTAPQPANANSVESSVSPSSSSSSSSINQAITSPPQQTRSILKIRPPTSTPPQEPASPPSTYFNYNPSAATGIGGMQGARYMDGPAAGSPVVSPAGEDRGREERGRSTSRGHGSSIYDRSSSRGTSSASTSSMSPGASRSPVGTRRGPMQVQPPQSSSLDEKIQNNQMQGQAQNRNSNQPQQHQQQHEPMDIDDIPDRGSTPTPHSSPQIVFRPLKDTSPASLPHHNSSAFYPTQSPSINDSSSSTISSPAGSSIRNSPTSSTLPKSDPPTSIPNKSSPSGSSPATIASTSTNAQPTMSRPTTGAQNQTARSSQQKRSVSQQLPSSASAGQSQSSGQGQGGLSGPGGQAVTVTGTGTGMDDDDGSSIMGRAANIANTAKDLLGALWYGANEDTRAKQGRQHKRGASLG